MARIKSGVLGGFSGTITNVVGSSWKGIDVIRSLPLSVANPKTAAQQAWRKHFADISKMAVNYMPGLIKPLWDTFATKSSGYALFIKENKNAPEFIDNTNYSFILSPNREIETTYDLYCYANNPYNPTYYRFVVYPKFKYYSKYIYSFFVIGYYESNSLKYSYLFYVNDFNESIEIITPAFASGSLIPTVAIYGSCIWGDNGKNASYSALSQHLL